MLRFILLTLLIFPPIVFADCQLNERCDYFNNDILIASPHIGTYKCTLDPANHKNVRLEVRLLTANTIADPIPLVLDNDNSVGIIKVMSYSGQNKYLENAFRITQININSCDETNGKTCDIQPIIMCERISD